MHEIEARDICPGIPKPRENDCTRRPLGSSPDPTGLLCLRGQRVRAGRGAGARPQALPGDEVEALARRLPSRGNAPRSGVVQPYTRASGASLGTGIVDDGRCVTGEGVRLHGLQLCCPSLRFCRKAPVIPIQGQCRRTCDIVDTSADRPAGSSCRPPRVVSGANPVTEKAPALPTFTPITSRFSFL